jgi:hypothetical protein
LAYADDFVLIAPTPSAMKKMLTICEEFAIEYNVLFNASKSECIYFHPKSRPNFLLHKYDITGLNFTINDSNIEFVDNYKHLGHVISSEQTDDTDISEKRAVFIGQANNVLCYFAKLSAKVKYQLFISYCTSFFGSELWRIDNAGIESVCTAWRRAVRRIWSLPYRAHGRLLPLLCNCLSVQDQLCNRYLNFVHRCLSDQSSHLVRTIAMQGLMFLRAHSPLGFNFMFCMRRYSFNLSDFLKGGFTKKVNPSPVAPADVKAASLLRELIDLRDGTLAFSNGLLFDYNDLKLLIDYVSTS